MKALRASLLLMALGSLSVACSSDEHSPIGAAGGLSEGCLVNSDCTAPWVCAFQRCHVECVTTRDCDGSLRCVGAHEAARVCQLDVEATCKTSADCAAGFVCSQDGACRDVCQSDAECVGEQLCAQGVCAEPTELDDSGQLPQLLPQRNCRLNSDCAAGSRCVQGGCLPQCATDRDCESGQRCDSGACLALEPECSGERCNCACREDIDCDSGETCDGCACQPAAAAECSVAADCDASKQCVDGSCRCSCVADCDCTGSLVCDGCACVAPPPSSSTLHDATLRDGADVSQMNGITDVETRLLLTGTELESTLGLEALQSVGSLEVTSVVNLAEGADATGSLAGLTGLRLIRGDLRVTSSTLKSLAFSPELQILGNVNFTATPLTCADLLVFEQALRAHAFSGSFVAGYNGSCPGFCGGGMCYPPP